ncbi:alpha/beta fold hydrolase [Pseudaestuariivita atlantica]|uniref:alpha/beta fold hydrolase n=1 Tax=Pseudaestuariivita atlantica TaxID=1317121 RepID=UPI00067B0A23|nr:alpha/beta hydrolase [Pseudaestuariivita atlantica]
MPVYTHQSHLFHYEDQGDAQGRPAIVALPGMMSDSASWGPIAPALIAERRLLRPDPRCAGRSPVLPTSVEAVTADTIALLDHLGLAQVDLVSHSMGSRVALDLAQRHPARIRRMVLSAVMPRFPRINCAVFDSLLQIRKTSPGDGYLRALFPWLFASPFFDDPARVEAAIAASLAYPHAQTLDGMYHQVVALKSGAPVQGMNLIDTPTLALFATEDRLVPVTTAPGHLSDMPDCEVRIIDGAGHALHWDQPDTVARAMLDFLNVD